MKSTALGEGEAAQEKENRTARGPTDSRQMPCGTISSRCGGGPFFITKTPVIPTTTETRSDTTPDQRNLNGSNLGRPTRRVPGCGARRRRRPCAGLWGSAAGHANRCPHFGCQKKMLPIAFVFFFRFYWLLFICTASLRFYSQYAGCAGNAYDGTSNPQNFSEWGSYTECDVSSPPAAYPSRYFREFKLTQNPVRQM